MVSAALAQLWAEHGAALHARFGADGVFCSNACPACLLQHEPYTGELYALDLTNGLRMLTIICPACITLMNQGMVDRIISRLDAHLAEQQQGQRLQA